MKHITLFIIIILPLTVTAQRFQGGLVLGLPVCQIDGDTYSGYNKAGVLGGVFVNTDLAHLFSGQMEIRYISKGAAAKNKADNPDYYKARLQYIEIPVTARYEFMNDLHGEGGLAVGYMIKAEQDLDGNGYYPYEPGPAEFEISFLLGVHYDLFERLSFNARFQYSALPLYTFETGMAYHQIGGMYNNIITFSMYYRLGR